MYEYDQSFYDYLNSGSVSSAQRVVPYVSNMLLNPGDAVLDVGCGAGAWLSVWKKTGHEVLGIDGDYVDRARLLIEPDEFQPCDLKHGFDLGRRFALAQSLEVAEHLPHAAAAGFVKAICACSDLVLFAAAVPGQGGENHINEQPYSYWRDLFEALDYQMYDPVRQHILGDTAVQPWYRYNTFVYVKRGALQAAHDKLAPYLVDTDTVPKDVSPLLYRARKQILKRLPHQAQTGLAIIKKSAANLGKK